MLSSNARLVHDTCGASTAAPLSFQRQLPLSVFLAPMLKAKTKSKNKKHKYPSYHIQNSPFFDNTVINFPDGVQLNDPKSAESQLVWSFYFFFLVSKIQKNKRRERAPNLPIQSVDDNGSACRRHGQKIHSGA
jgi:hypothetical protein